MRGNFPVGLGAGIEVLGSAEDKEGIAWKARVSTVISQGCFMNKGRPWPTVSCCCQVRGSLTPLNITLSNEI